LNKIVSEDFHNVTKTCSQKNAGFKLSIHQRILKMFLEQISILE